MRQTVYLMLNPFNDYAAAMMRIAYEKYGLQAVCLITNRQEAVLESGQVKLNPDHVRAFYYAEDRSDEELVADLISKYDPVAVFPYEERVLEWTANLLQRLPIAWNKPAVIRLFRNKQALKEHVRKVDPTIKLNHTRRVTSAEEAKACRSEFAGSFVLKPNDGMGTRSVALVKQANWAEAIDAFFAASQCQNVIMEDYIEAIEPGVEYAVNGQIDESGCIVYQSIISYFKIAAGDRAFLYYQDHHVPFGSDLFCTLTDYATRVMKATGLKRSPFHMEVILTKAGPILVEVAARFPGSDLAKVINDVHGGAFDVFDMAAHYYLFDRPYAGPGPDWQAYNATKFIRVLGIADTDQIIANIRGVKAVESLPAFRRWSHKPLRGTKLKRTVDIFTRSYGVHLISTGSMESLQVAANQVRSLLQINVEVSLWQHLVAHCLLNFARISRRWRLGLNLWQSLAKQSLIHAATKVLGLTNGKKSFFAGKSA